MDFTDFSLLMTASSGRRKKQGQRPIPPQRPIAPGPYVPIGRVVSRQGPPYAGPPTLPPQLPPAPGAVNATAVIGYVIGAVGAVFAAIGLIMAAGSLGSPWSVNRSFFFWLAIGLLNLIGFAVMLAGGIRLQDGRGGLRAMCLGGVAQLCAIWLTVVEAVVTFEPDGPDVAVFGVFAVIASMLPGSVIIACRGRAVRDWLAYCAAVRQRPFR